MFRTRRPIPAISRHRFIYHLCALALLLPHSALWARHAHVAMLAATPCPDGKRLCCGTSFAPLPSLKKKKRGSMIKRTRGSVCCAHAARNLTIDSIRRQASAW